MNCISSDHWLLTFLLFLTIHIIDATKSTKMTLQLAFTYHGKLSVNFPFSFLKNSSHSVSTIMCIKKAFGPKRVTFLN